VIVRALLEQALSIRTYDYQHKMADQPNTSTTPAETDFSHAQEGLATTSEAVATTSQTFSLIQNVDQFFGSPISTTVAAKRRKKDKRVFLGEWHDFLYDSKVDLYYTPVLEKERFWQYLTRSQGILRPEGECVATSAWAKLLYGLGITPEKKLLSKTLDTSNHGENHNMEIKLELDGEILCHIINLYQLSRDERMIETSVARNMEEWSTAFGHFELIKDPNSGKVVKVNYRRANDRSLKAVKRPFQNFSQWCEHSIVNPDRVIPMYELSLNLGTSDSTIAWPDKTATLTDRIKAILPNMRFLDFGHVTANLVLITLSWLEEPDKIFRRVTLNGGSDKSFLEDILRKIDEESVPNLTNDDKVEKIKADCKSNISSRFNKNVSYIYEFLLHRNEDSPSFRDQSWKVPTRDIMQEILKQYGQEIENGWKQSIHMNAVAVRSIILWDDIFTGLRSFRIDSKRVYLLELDRSTELWTTMALRLQISRQTKVE
jgi:hypothetical protein